jgi:hypothetical protein
MYSSLNVLITARPAIAVYSIWIIIGTFISNLAFSPWINTCIGFYNRKAFILMLIYTTVATILNLLAFLLSIPFLLDKLKAINALLVFQLIFILTALVFNCIIMVTIVLFLKFHLELIFNNFTTLETLELKRQGKSAENSRSQYNIGIIGF